MIKCSRHRLTEYETICYFKQFSPKTYPLAKVHPLHTDRHTSGTGKLYHRRLQHSCIARQ